MKKLLFLFMVLITGCTNPSNEALSEPVHPGLFKDRDALFSRIEFVHDFIGKTYSKEQKEEFKEKQDYKDYRKVLTEFITNELNKEIDTYQTYSVNTALNHRWMVVTTKDNWVYKIGLKKWEEYDGIWTIDAYSELVWRNYPVPDVESKSNQPSTVDLKNEQSQKITDSSFDFKKIDAHNDEYSILVKNRILEELQNPKWVTTTFYEEGKTYALIKSSADNKDGVEFDRLELEGNKVQISYETFDLHVPRPGLQDYLLYELNGQFEVEFLNTKSTSE
jgi:hypothetical protein